PTIAQLKRRYFALCDVPVQSIRADPQILGSLPYVHHFARFAHEERSPCFYHAQELACATPSSGRNNNPQGAACVNFMSLRPTARQAFLACNCPSNAVNPRQFTWYCRQVLQNVGPHGY